jgi:D-alanyl-lipoteichoic acid acyltransferase DltB (MBOAT superfamily)
VKKREKTILALALIANFGILVFLKYSNFLAGGINQILGHAADGGPLPMLKLFLPLGISFYTFQAAGYLIDVSRGAVKAERNFLKFALFISFFPQIVQGPISSFGQLAGQLTAEHKPEFIRFKLGLELILWGYFKKLVIADRAVIAINTVTADYTQYTGTTILAAGLLYALQLYADFSAGIDISRGIARILGIDMIDNFRRPYFSRSINEYWRRWHISLGAWMKQYIFYPVAMSEAMMGLSKKIKNGGKNTPAREHLAKTLPAAIASLVVFLVVGLWHGANGKYVAFGLWNGLIVMLSILMKPVFTGMTDAMNINVRGWGWRHFQMIRTFILVLIGYVFDIAPDFGGSLDMMRRMITDQGLALGYVEMLSLNLNRQNYLLLAAMAVLIWLISRRQEKLKIDDFADLVMAHGAWMRWLIVFVMIVMILVLGTYGPGFDPADFVYMQF